MKTKVVGLIAVAAVIYSCGTQNTVSSTTPKVIAKGEPTRAVVSGVLLSEELMEGKNLYENNCAKCHKLFEPTDFNKEQWKPIVMRMQKKARLEDAQGVRIYDYLTANL